jgi:hypothetical protein
MLSAEVRLLRSRGQVHLVDDHQPCLSGIERFPKVLQVVA